MNPSRPDRRVVTFYSFKGGVGRTMTLANVGWRLAARHGLDVVLVDWDLEAPGLHTFFDIPPERLANARGLLDYFDDWVRLAGEGAPSPPVVADYVLSVDGPEWSPPHGSLSLVIAGRMDAQYGPRLHQFDIRRLYRDHAGAAAVEHLRAGLVERFGVVLVDSRTGFTDIGGVCTVQLPDRVVLMTVPSEQSLAGIERVAHDIIDAGAWRGERRPPGIWVALCRMPYIEETELVRGWVEEHRSWFAAGVARGLWRAADHPHGLDTIRIPHASRWGFGERILWGEAVDRDDPLARAYEQLASRLLLWAGGLAEFADPVPGAPLDALRLQVGQADQRGDAVGGIVARFQLGLALLGREQLEEAAAALEQALLLAKGHEIEIGPTVLRYALGRARLGQRRYGEAQGLFEEVLDDVHAAGAMRERVEAALLEAVERQVAAGDGPAAWPAVKRLVLRLRETGRYREALGWVERMLATGLMGESLGSALTLSVQLARLMDELPGDAEERLQRARGLVNEDERGFMLDELKNLYIHLGRLDEATAVMRELLARLETGAKGEEHFKVADKLRELAEALEAKGDLASAKQRREEAVEILVKELGPPLRALAVHLGWRLSLPSDIAKDLVQETLVELLRNDAFVLRKWSPERGSFKRFALAFGYHYMRDLVHGRRRKVSEEDRAQSEPEMKEWVDMLVDHFRAVCTEEEWRLFELIVLEEHPMGEVAEVMGLPMLTIYQRKHRLFERLRLIGEQILAERQAS
jgi:RNA polymerase sigma factor (sigma-70 family)